MYLKQPIPLVIFRQGHILFNDNFNSLVSGQVMTPSMADTALVREIPLPINQAALNYAELHRAVFKLGIIGQIYEFRAEERLKKGNTEPLPPAPYIKAREHLYNYVDTAVNNKVSCSCIVLRTGGCLGEVSSIESFTTVQKKPETGIQLVEGVNDCDYSVNTFKVTLPTGKGSEWCRAGNPDEQERLIAALLSTEGLDDLSKLLVKIGAIKAPVWHKFTDFVKQHELRSYFKDMQTELYWECCSLIREFMPVKEEEDAK